MQKLVIIALIIFVGLTSCTDSETDGTQEMDTTSVIKTDTVAPVIIDTVTVQKKTTKLEYNAEDATHLLLYEKFSLGITYEQLKEKMPAVKPLHAEDYNEQLGKKGLQESLQDISFLKHKGRLEFNFKNDTLYRYSIVFTETNDTKGYTLYEKILNYYSDQLGNYQLVNIEEDNHYAQTNMWYLNPDYLIAVYNLNTGNITIAAQTYKPGQ